MFCRYCRKTIVDDSIYCAYCGKLLNDFKTMQKAVIKCKSQNEVTYGDFLRLVYTTNRGYRIPSEEEIYPLVVISDYLISHGFTFCRASTADGISEILHTGDAPYHVIYHDLENFRNHFVEDFFTCQEKECKCSGGWISSLNYGHVDVYLKKDALLFHAAVGDGNIVEWYGYTEQDHAFIEQTDKAMRRILATCAHIERQVLPLTKALPNYWD